MHVFRPLLVLSTFVLSFALAGCSASFSIPDTPSTGTLGEIHGIVHGGQQPVVGAHVYVYEAGTSAAAGPGILASSANASKSLLTSTSGTSFDGKNYYVTTNSSGGFSVGGDYTCDSYDEVYLYAVGGNPGSGTNSSASFLAALGRCPLGGGNVAAAFPTVWMNEVTTVAAAYALAGWASDALHIANDASAETNTTFYQATNGLVNAFVTANLLVNVATGVANTSSGAMSSIPNTTINTLANILASCINESDTSKPNCTTLFANATRNGATCTANCTGQTATDTATAAIYIAQNPFNNVSTLYGLQAGVGAPFTSDLGSQPSNFLMPVTYSGGGLKQPVSLAVDSLGDVWAANASGTSAVEIGANGTYLTGSSGIGDGGLAGDTLAIDLYDNVWVPSLSGKIYEFTSAGANATNSPFSPSGVNAVDNVCMDGYGNLWVLNGNNTNVVKVTNGTGEATYSSPVQYGVGCAVNSLENIALIGTASVLNSYSYSGTTMTGVNTATTVVYSDPYSSSLVIDGANNIWYESTGYNTLAYSVSNALVADITTDLLSAPAVDGLDRIWLTGQYSSVYNTSGKSLALWSEPNTLFSQPYASQVDGSGNVWTVNNTASVPPLVEYIGAAAPAVTPIAVAIGKGKIGTIP